MTRIAAALAALLFLFAPHYASAQMVDNVFVPRSEVSVAVPIHTVEIQRESRSWTYGRVDASVAANLNSNAAVEFRTLQNESGVYLFGGPRFATAFFYGSARDPIPGRFFVELLGGVVWTGSDDRTRTAVQAGAGFDLMLLPAHGVSMRCEIASHTPTGYPVPSHSTLSVGLLVGPRLKR